jgi:hypothetical protein
MNRSILKTISFCLHVICGFALVALSFHHASAKETAAKRYVSPQDTQSPSTDEEIQEEMKKYLGIRYKRAGASRRGFDCSGFVKVIYQEIYGVDLPHQSSQQSRCPELESVSLDSLQTGDLVFFSSGRKKRSISHVGIYLSEGKFIHAARSHGVVISQLDDSYWRSKVIVAKRLAGRIPVESEKSTLDLAMSAGSEGAVSFHYEKREFPAFSPSLFGNGLGNLSVRGQFQSMELDYAKAINPFLTSHLTVFREYLSSADEGNLLAYHPILGSPEQTTRAYAQGLRLAGGIRPTENITVAPSLSFFDYGPAVNEASLPKLALGLTFDLFSSSNGWALSTGLRMPLRRYSSSALDEGLDDHALNLSLTYRQQLSDRVYLSITGDNFIKFAPALRAPSSRFDTEDQQFSLMLHFFY